MKRALVLGSEGFVGSAICDNLLDSGYLVVGMDNFLKGYTPTEHYSHPNFFFNRCDLTRGVPSYHEYDLWIIAAATLGGITYFHDHRFEMINYNSKIMSAVLDSAVDLKPKKIVYLSSSMVYESVKEFPSDEDSVDRFPAPASSYGFAKLAGERSVKALHDTHGIEYGIARLFNCVGCDEVFPKDFKQGQVHVLPEFCYYALTSKADDPVKIIGLGNQIRFLTHKSDLARGIRLVAEHSGCDTFNISSNYSISMRDLLNLVWNKVHGHDANIITGEQLPYDVQIRHPDTRKASEILGFEAIISLEDSVNEVLEWMKDVIKKRG